MELFCTLASGSSGNTALYVSGQARILIDGGTTTKHIRTELSTLGLTLSDLTHILITHTHSDHISALPVLLAHTQAKLLCSRGAHSELCDKVGEYRPECFEQDELLDLCGVPVQPFATLHDSPGSVG